MRALFHYSLNSFLVDHVMYFLSVATTSHLKDIS